MKCSSMWKRNYFILIVLLVVLGNTLTLKICSEGNFEGILGNLGEILGKYRKLDVKSVGFKGLNAT